MYCDLVKWFHQAGATARKVDQRDKVTREAVTSIGSIDVIVTIILKSNPDIPVLPISEAKSRLLQVL